MMDGQAITDHDIREALHRYPPAFRQNLLNPAVRTTWLTRYIDQKVVYRLANENKLYRDPEFLRQLNESKTSILMSLYYSSARKKLKFSDNEVRSEYERIMGPAVEMNFSQMVLPNLATANTASKLLLQGKSFASIASKMSTDRASAIRGGNMGYLKPHDIDAELRPTLAQLKDGKLSAPLSSSKGVKIVLLHRKRSYTPTPEDLEKWRRLVEDTHVFESINNAKSKLKIDVDEAALTDILSAIAKD